MSNDPQPGYTYLQWVLSSFDFTQTQCCNTQVSLKPSKENPLVNLVANVVLPVLILKELSAWSPLKALILALAFPLGYGLWSYWKSKRINFISLLGLMNTLFTGGFALFKLDGFWFVVKEAAFPFMIGCFVLFSAFRKQPFLKMMLFETGALNTEEILKRIQESQKTAQLLRLFQKGTFFFSLTFFFSAFLNFVLAYRIFTKISVDLSEAEQTALLNQQIAEMTWQGYAVIFAPSIVFFFLILYFFFRSLSKLTGLDFDHLIQTDK